MDLRSTQISYAAIPLRPPRHFLLNPQDFVPLTTLPAPIRTIPLRRQPCVIGQIFPGILATSDTIPSKSVGLHYRSAPLNAVGSLTWDGYDQSRILGEVGSFNLVKRSQNYMILSLLDVQVGVEKEFSPSNASSFTGLLQLWRLRLAQQLFSTFPWCSRRTPTCTYEITLIYSLKGSSARRLTWGSCSELLA